MSYDLNSKKIKNREKLIKYRKAFKGKNANGGGDTSRGR